MGKPLLVSPTPMRPLLSRREACAFLGVSISTLQRLLARREIGAYWVGGQVRISAAQLAQFLDRQIED